MLQDGRLYQLIRQHEFVGERTLEISLLEPRAEAYVFTFGQRAERKRLNPNGIDETAKETS